MPPLGIFNLGKQTPKPVAVTLGTPEERAAAGRLLFIKYLLLTHQIGDGDLGPAPKGQP